MLYSVYVWTGLFHYALEGLWVLAALVVALGGLAREKATGVALFSLALPISRLKLFLIRAAVASVQSIVLGLTSALLIPALSSLVGEAYPFSQALGFGGWMSGAGLVILAFGLLISELFEGEFTAPVVGLCSLTLIFLGYRGHTLHGWNVFDVMSATTFDQSANPVVDGNIPLARSGGLPFILHCAAFHCRRSRQDPGLLTQNKSESARIKIFHREALYLFSTVERAGRELEVIWDMSKELRN